MELEELNESINDGEVLRPSITLKSSLDLVDAALRSKQLEFEQVNNEFKQVSNLVKELRNKTSDTGRNPTSKGGKEKEKKKRKKQSSTNDDHLTDQSFQGQGIVSIATDSAVFVTSFFIEYRSVILFGLSAVGIYLVGDYASV
jgi:Ulp1 family protease